MKKDIKPAIYASLLVAFIYTLIISVVSSGGRYYFHPEKYDEIASLPYKEAQELMMQEAPKITRLESLTNAMHFKEFWYGALSQWVLYTFVCFVACLLYVRLSQSNNALVRDAGEKPPAHHS